MTKEEIINFRQSLANMSIEELNAEAKKIQDDISKMILDSDLIIKAAIVDSLIKEREEK